MIIRLITILFSVYMLLWLSSFIDSGYLIDEKESLGIYRKIVLISMILSGTLLPVIGHLADRAPSKIIVPLAFSARGAAAYAFV